LEIQTKIISDTPCIYCETSMSIISTLPNMNLRQD
jgi:hypothetical protein